MSASRERAEGLACWSGRHISVHPANDMQDELGLGEGRTNQNFIATSPEGDRYFVRIGSDLPSYGVSRAKEHEAVRAAAESGIGAPVLYAELPDVLVTTFVSGKPLNEAGVKAATDGNDPQLLAALTAAIRKLHATPMPAEIANAVTHPPQWTPPDLPRWIAYAREGGFGRLPLLADVDVLMSRVEAAAGAPAADSAVFCHFDLLPDNFVCHRAPLGDTSGAPGGEAISVVIVDFEYCNAGQALMDLAVLAMGCGLTEAQQRTLLGSYLQREPVDADAARFRALLVLATLRETFWGIVAEVSGCSALSPSEAAAYTDQNYAKFLAAVRDFEQPL